jgi:hypothetical protein
MLKDYKTRVESTCDFLYKTSEILNREYAELRWLNNKADTYASSGEFLTKPFPIRWETTGDSTMVEFLGVEYDIVESDLTGGPWFKYYPDKPKTFLLPWFNENDPSKLVELPLAYIIPPEWEEVIRRLDLHGIDYYTTDTLLEVMVETYRFTDPEWSQRPYEGRFRLNADYTVQMETMAFPKGSAVVPLKQRTSRVITHIFEPDAPDSYLGWGFFNAIFEQKEYSETYVMERIAREMIDENPTLLAEFEERRASDPDFARNQWAQTNWFYSRSPWWDEKKNLYPVCRIVDAEVLKNLVPR